MAKGVPMDNTIENILASTMNDYGHCFRSTVDRFAVEGRDRDYFHSAQVSPRNLGPGVYADMNDPDYADGVGRTSFQRPSPPAYSSPRAHRFTSIFKQLDVDPKWTMDDDTKAWTDHGGLVAGNAFGKQPRRTIVTPRSYCNGQYTETGAPESSGKNRLLVNSHRSKFESRIDRFGASPPREEKNETMATKTAKAAARRGPGIHDQGNGRGPKQTYDWRKDEYMKRPNGTFMLPKARARPRHHMSSGRGDGGSSGDPDSLGPGCYEHDMPTQQRIQEQSRPSAAFRSPSKPIGHRSPYHKGPDSTWSLKTDSRTWTKNRRGFAWAGGRTERPLSDRLTHRGAVQTS